MRRARIKVRAGAGIPDRRRETDGPDRLEIVARQDFLLLQHATSIITAAALLLRAHQIKEVSSATATRSGQIHDLLVHELRRIHRRVKFLEEIDGEFREIERDSGSFLGAKVLMEVHRCGILTRARGLRL